MEIFQPFGVGQYQSSIGAVIAASPQASREADLGNSLDRRKPADGVQAPFMDQG
jgi:hypothetical protein